MDETNGAAAGHGADRGDRAVVVGAVIGAGRAFQSQPQSRRSVGRVDLVVAVWIVCGAVRFAGRWRSPSWPPRSRERADSTFICRDLWTAGRFPVGLDGVMRAAFRASRPRSPGTTRDRLPEFRGEKPSSPPAG
jgi:hypothetical protein